MTVSFGPVKELPIDRLLLFKAPGESQSMVVMTRWLDAVAAKLAARD